MTFKITRKQRLIATIGISFLFFIAEIVAGFYTHSLALVADAFHYLSDLIGFAVALAALMISENRTPPKQLTFGWARATLLGAFFNGVFLLALGVSILVQAIERFTNITPIEQPKVVLIVGCVGLGLNLLVMSFLHEHDHDHGHGHGHGHGHRHGDSHDHGHDHSLESHEHIHEGHTTNHSTNGMDVQLEARSTSPDDGHYEHKHTSVIPTSPGRDFGMLGVLVHVIGDAINNVGVIIAALIIWKAEGSGRYYADPAIGVFIAVMIFLTAWPLTRKSGRILLQVAPNEINLEDVKHDIQMIPGVQSVHELHIWRLDQQKSVASAHVVVDDKSVKTFTEKAKIINQCLHAYGIHSVTLQPEGRHLNPPDFVGQSTALDPGTDADEPTTRRRDNNSSCQTLCGNLCDRMRCCTPLRASE